MVCDLENTSLPEKKNTGRNVQSPEIILHITFWPEINRLNPNISHTESRCHGPKNDVPTSSARVQIKNVESPIIKNKHYYCSFIIKLNHKRLYNVYMLSKFIIYRHEIIWYLFNG